MSSKTHCDICNKKVIEYTHVDDHEIMDEAVDPEVYNDIIEEIQRILENSNIYSVVLSDNPASSVMNSLRFSKDLLRLFSYRTAILHPQKYTF